MGKILLVDNDTGIVNSVMEFWNDDMAENYNCDINTYKLIISDDLFDSIKENLLLSKQLKVINKNSTIYSEMIEEILVDNPITSLVTIEDFEQKIIHIQDQINEIKNQKGI
jgi:hypothetical protein